MSVLQLFPIFGSIIVLKCTCLKAKLCFVLLLVAVNSIFGVFSLVFYYACLPWHCRTNILVQKSFFSGWWLYCTVVNGFHGFCRVPPPHNLPRRASELTLNLFIERFSLVIVYMPNGTLQPQHSVYSTNNALSVMHNNYVGPFSSSSRSILKYINL